MGKVSVEVKERYNAKVYDRVALRLRKDRPTNKAAALEAAAEAGESLNEYVEKAIAQRMEREEE